MSSPSYIEKNRGFVTASKLKTFIKSPEAYYLEYIKEVPLEREESKAFTLGTAFDDALSYGPIEFHKKYFVDEGLTVAEMTDECAARGIEVTGKGKEYLMQALYGEEYGKRIRLTASDGVAITGMLREANRQPLWDVHGDYTPQACIEASYKGLALRGTLDRLSVEKKQIRDYKTTSNLKNFTFELSSKYGYEISMAFYYALVKIHHDVECDIILDVVQSSGVYQSEVFMYQKEHMNAILSNTIIPALDKLVELHTKWNETGDEAVWMEKTDDRYKLFDLPTYPILSTGLQTEISFI